MFLDQQWTDHSVEISYGHEIELSWLMCEACQSLNDDALISQAEKDAVRIAGLSLGKAMCSGHGFLERIEFDKPVDSSRIWWVQAEALVGFYNAFQISNERQFLKATEDIWQFIQSQHKVSPKSEWLWSSDDRELAPESRAHYLAGFWKGPYHNGRAMLELLRRVPLSDSADAT
jgi:mannobiose 2-epimerase